MSNVDKNSDVFEKVLLEKTSNALVVLISGGGYQNFGDDLILSKWVTVYRKFDLVLVCGDNIEKHHGLNIRKHLPHHVIDSDTITEIKILACNYKKILIHLVGGGFCNDKFGTAQNLFKLLLQLQDFGAIIGTGVSFYPISQESRSLLNGIIFKYLSFRDIYSRRIYLGRCSPFYGDDLLPVLESSYSSGSKVLFLNIQNQFDLVESLSLVAKRVCEIASAGSYSSVVLCELCKGDLDIKRYLNIDGLKVIERSEVLAGKIKPSHGDVFIGTRYHFRMMMESAGATGICILADDYYSNKHEKTGPSYNFLPGRSALMSVEEFLNVQLTFPCEKKSGINLRVIGKRIESFLIKIIMCFWISR